MRTHIVDTCQIDSYTEHMKNSPASHGKFTAVVTESSPQADASVTYIKKAHNKVATTGAYVTSILHGKAPSKETPITAFFPALANLEIKFLILFISF